MPIIIKSSNGQRTCRISKEPTPDPLKDLLAALKNLTFKVELEFKITDVINNEFNSCQQSTQDSKPQAEPAKDSSSITLRPLVSQPTTSSKTGPIEKNELVHASTSVPHSVSSRETVYAPPATSVEATHEKIPSQKYLSTTTPSPRQSVATQEVATSAIAPVQPKLTVPIPTSMVPPQVAKTKAESRQEPKFDLGRETQPDPRPEYKLSYNSETKPKFNKTPVPLNSIVKHTCCTAVDDGESPPVFYVSAVPTIFQEIIAVLSQMSPSLDASQPSSITAGDIVLVKSCEDDEWYRGIVELINADEASIFYFDWGLRETLPIDRLRILSHPDLSLSKYPACAVKVQFINTSEDLIKKATEQEALDMLFEDYDHKNDLYSVSIL